MRILYKNKLEKIKTLIYVLDLLIITLKISILISY